MLDYVAINKEARIAGKSFPSPHVPGKLAHELSY